MLVSIYAFVKKQLSSRVTSNVSNMLRSQNKTKPSREMICQLKAIEERIPTLEMKMLDMMEKKLDAINRRIDDITMH